MLTNTKILSKHTSNCCYFTTYFDSFSSFVFNGKEKDYESGFHYYGSRYYANELSMWLSTDPMSDRYPSLTPYNYCANNPIKLIDPNGEEIDEWSINRNTGKLTHLNNIKHYATDENGQVMEMDRVYNQEGNRSIDVSHESCKHIQQTTEYVFIPFSDSKQAELFYYFAADNSNVEWAFARGLYGNGYVGTNYNKSKTKMLQIFGQVLFGNIILGSHSHPAGGSPSKDITMEGKIKYFGDMNVAKRSKYMYQREVYDVPHGNIYGYDNTTYDKNVPFDYKERVQNRKDLLK